MIVAKVDTPFLGPLVKIRTGKLDANASSPNGKYPFFTCAVKTLKIDNYAYDCECALVAGNGDLNAKYYIGRFNAYQRTYIVESKDKETLNVRYLYYFLDKYIEKLRTGSIGGVIKYIKLSHLTDIKIPLPPITEQKRIAAILDKADTIRREREKAIQLADEFLRSVFLDMFGDPVVNPKGWRQVKIKEMCAVKTGNTPSRNVPEYYGDDIEWIKSDNINTPYHYLTKAEEKLSKEGRKVGRVVPANSTLVTCIAGSFDCIGNAALADRSVSFNQQINAITPSDDIDPYFLYIQILIAKRLIQAASTNSMKGMVSKSRLENIMLVKPPFKLQKKFGNIFKKFITTNDNLIQNHKNSDYLFNSLSQNAFSGKL